MKEPHPIQRAQKHYGIELDLAGLRRWERMVREGEATFLLRQTSTKAVYRIVHEGVRVRVVYDHAPHQAHCGIITVLPHKGKAGFTRPGLSDRERRAISIRNHRRPC